MPSRWSEYDTDAERLPEGMERIGYDADTQTYTFRDADGSMWESAPGSRYGQLRRVTYGDDEYDEGQLSAMEPLNPSANSPAASWRQEMMPLLNWFLLIGVCLLGFFWYLSRGSGGSGGDLTRKCVGNETPYVVRAGDTCWAIAEESSVPLDVLVEANTGLDCDRLVVGETICIPSE